MESLLEIRGLRIDVKGSDGMSPIVKNIDLTVHRGEVVALIGESGSGKTTICLAALGYVRPGLSITKGTIKIGQTDVLSLQGQALRDLRGKRVAYVAQSAAASFNPGLNIGYQVEESALVHHVMPRDKAHAKALSLYLQLKLPEPDIIGHRFPHQVSGGQLQRLMAAMAMCCGPKMLVFDEPTTALDVTTQINVLQSFKEAIQRQNVAAIYVTHDLAVVAQIADRIIVLLNGEIQEQGTTEDIINQPQHEYTRILMAVSDPDTAREDAARSENSGKTRETRDPLIDVHNVTAGYGGTNRDGLPRIPILKDITMSVGRSSVVGVIGESGSGKTTLGHVIAGLLPLSRGEISLDGTPLKPSVNERSRDELQKIQMVFQMADTALNPSHTIGKILGRPIEYFQGLTGRKKNEKIAELLEMVKLSPHFKTRKPEELSGGQKQRINLARAFAADPKIVICDEVTSGLDTVVRMAIIDLIKELHNDLGISFLFISHDISTIASLAEEVVVMYQGRIVESGDIDKILKRPEKPYTQILMASVPHLRMGWLDKAIKERNEVLQSAEDLVLAD
jgi:peptide/nickel transport system ATP-binding protein